MGAQAGKYKKFSNLGVRKIHFPKYKKNVRLELESVSSSPIHYYS